MNKQLTIIVEELLLQTRIDKYLTLVLKTSQSLSRTQIQKMILNKQVLVNNKIVCNKYVIQLNDKILINFINDKPLKLAKDYKQKLDIVYEDDVLMVINKPKNLVVHPAVGNWDNTLVNLLLAKNIKLSNLDEARPGIVHRLDKNTTGLLIIAKNNIAHQSLSKQLQNKTLTRKYFVLVRGIINNKSGLIDGAIGRSKQNRKKMAIVSGGKSAQTKFKVLKVFNDSKMTFIECELLTGRTHQIRVHLSSIKHPVVADHLYGIKEDLTEPYEQYLHAYEVEFIHPISGKLLKFTTDLPKLFKEKLKTLS